VSGSAAAAVLPPKQDAILAAARRLFLAAGYHASMDQGAIEAALTQLARRFLDRLLAPECLALHRMLVTEAARFPDLAAELYAAGPGAAVRRLAGYLAQQTAAGRLAVAEPTLAAEQFFGALCGHRQLRGLLGVAAAPGADERQRIAAYAVRSFLRAHRPG
jgi:hypothetical protein